VAAAATPAAVGEIVLTAATPAFGVTVATPAFFSFSSFSHWSNSFSAPALGSLRHVPDRRRIF
jgi:hypothetical protein